MTLMLEMALVNMKLIDGSHPSSKTERTKVHHKKEQKKTQFGYQVQYLHPPRMYLKQYF